MMQLAFMLLPCLSACVLPDTSRLSELAAGSDLDEQVVPGRGFRHRLFANRAVASADAGPLIVFLEGDGRPWLRGGTVPARDPTSREPLAFELFLATSLPAIYITRPCYEGLRDDGCGTRMWTSARYSDAVVASLAGALQQSTAGNDKRSIVLVGYSGGGVLATLLAARVPETVGAVTIAANLDVAAWTSLHGYLPLDQSLNPALVPLSDGVARIALVGGNDTNVPPEAIKGFLAAHPDTRVVTFADFDHVCCWARDWHLILPSLLDWLDLPPTAGRDAPRSGSHADELGAAAESGPRH